MSVLISTSLGDLVVDLYCKDTPQTAKNFLKLCKMKHYNNNLFFKVEKNFIAQTGDPSATGDPGTSVYGLAYGMQARYFRDEIRPHLRHNRVGLLAMSNSREHENGSAFYITLSPSLDFLDGKHTIFGEVAEGEGLDVLARLNETFCDKGGRPYQALRIRSTDVLADPFDDLAGLDYPPESPRIEGEDGPGAIDGGRLRDDEHWLEEYEGLDAEEVQRRIREKELRSKAVVLQMLGDIKDADARPPENVLFVCKLHPRTEDADLELVFSRFGEVLMCHVVRDRKTGTR